MQPDVSPSLYEQQQDLAFIDQGELQIIYRPSKNVTKPPGEDKE